MAKKLYDEEKDYMAEIQKAVAAQDYGAAALLEQQRNAKIEGMGLQYDKTTDYEKYLPTQPQSVQQSVYPNAQSYVPGAQEIMAQQQALAQLQLPEFQSTLGPQVKQLLAQLQGVPAFNYDPSSDVAYEQYKKIATQEGQRAAEDTMARVSARTGGMMSSYGASAAAQQQQYYAQQIAGKMPEFEQMAYQKYLNEYEQLERQLRLTQGLEQDEYSRYRDTVSDFYRQQQTQYGALGDAYQMARDEYSLGYQREQDIREMAAMEYERQLAREKFDYQKESDAADMSSAERQFEHKQSVDERELALRSASSDLDWLKYRASIAEKDGSDIAESTEEPEVFREMSYDEAVSNLLESGLRNTHSAQDAAAFTWQWLNVNKDNLDDETFEKIYNKYIKRTGE